MDGSRRQPLETRQDCHASTGITWHQHETPQSVARLTLEGVPDRTRHNRIPALVAAGVVAAWPLFSFPSQSDPYLSRLSVSRQGCCDGWLLLIGEIGS